MTMDAISIEIEELTTEQAAAIWREQRRERARPANYMEFVIYLRAKAIGQAFSVKVPAGIDNAERARAIRKWFGEAGKERVRFDKDEKGATVETPEPVSIKCKQDTRKEKRQVIKDGKKGEVEVTVIDRLHGKLVPLDTSTHGRASEQVDEIVDKLTVPAGAKSAKLPDGRDAVLTRSGHWRAPKLVATATSLNPSSETNGAANGVTGG